MSICLTPHQLSAQHLLLNRYRQVEQYSLGLNDADADWECAGSVFERGVSLIQPGEWWEHCFGYSDALAFLWSCEASLPQCIPFLF
jgi:hypothetical protein